MFSRTSLMLLCVVGGCTLTQPAVDSCSDTRECQTLFGPASVCAPSGFCEPLVDEPRCSLVWPTSGLADDTILIGTIIDGSLDTHLARARSVELAVRDATESGGVSGHGFALLVCTNEENATFDGLDQDEASLAAARYLAAAGIVALIGPPASGATRRIFEEGPEELLLISPSASSTELTDLEPPATDQMPGRLWRTAAPDSGQAERIAADIMARSIERVAVIYAVGSYGDALSAAVQEALPTNVQLTLHPFSSSGMLSEVQTTVGRSDAQEVLVVSSDTSEITRFLNAAADSARYDDKTFFVTDAAANRDLVAGLDMMVRARLRGSRPASPDAATRDTFLSRYAIHFEDNVSDLSFTANAYDAAWVALYAIAWATQQEQDLSALSVGRGLRQLSSGAAVPIQMSSWQTVVDAFADGQSVNISGASGELDFDPVTEEVGADFELWAIDMSGQLVTL